MVFMSLCPTRYLSQNSSQNDENSSNTSPKIYCKTMVAFSFILCLSIMHQDASSVDYTIPSYRPLTYVVCKNMSMSEMEKPSIQSFKVTIDHTHGHMKRKFSFLKQTYIFTVQNALHIVSMSFVHFIDNLAATLFRIF